MADAKSLIYTTIKGVISKLKRIRMPVCIMGFYSSFVLTSYWLAYLAITQAFERCIDRVFRVSISRAYMICTFLAFPFELIWKWTKSEVGEALVSNVLSYHTDNPKRPNDIPVFFGYMCLYNLILCIRYFYWKALSALYLLNKPNVPFMIYFLCSIFIPPPP